MTEQQFASTLISRFVQLQNTAVGLGLIPNDPEELDRLQHQMNLINQLYRETVGYPIYCDDAE